MEELLAARRAERVGRRASRYRLHADGALGARRAHEPEAPPPPVQLLTRPVLLTERAVNQSDRRRYSITHVIA